MARLLLKVLKEIYEVLGLEFAFKTFYFITIFYSLSVCQRTDHSVAPNAAEGSLRPLGGVRCGEPLFERSTERQLI